MIWLWAYIGGIAGTFIMDFGAKRFFMCGVNDALGGLIGKWVVGFSSGRFVIDGNEELKTPETLREQKIGKAFHYFIGGGGVALAYPLVFLLTGHVFPNNHIFGHILGGAIFGLTTVLLTWFLQYPCFGFSWMGRNARWSQLIDATLYLKRKDGVCRYGSTKSDLFHE